MFLGKWKSHTRMAQPSEKFRWKKSMACPCFLHRVFSKAVLPSMKVVVGVYINDFFLVVEYANKMVRQIKEWCFFWSVSLQPTKRNTFPHAVLLRHERVACHCFMSFGLCDKNGTASCGYKSQPLSARLTFIQNTRKDENICKRNRPFKTGILATYVWMDWNGNSKE